MRFALIVMVLAGIGAVSAYEYAWYSLDDPAAMTAPVIYKVLPHSGFSKVAADLSLRGVVADPIIWSLYARLGGYASQIKAGEYEIVPGTTSRKLLRQLVDGQVLLHPFTIIDGWQMRDLLAAMRSNPQVRSTLSTAGSELMARIGAPPTSPEAQFLPETYKIAAGTTDIELLTIAHLALVKELQNSWSTRADNLPLKSPQELLILASIVEKETGLAQERPKIAGVYLQRLLDRMRLQADPTVIYGLGEKYDGDIHTTDLRADGPYNTYTREGLPPTPIAFAGAAAIRATAHPEMTGALYFVASSAGDGSHVFSKTLKQHNEAVAGYLRRLRATNSKSVAIP